MYRRNILAAAAIGAVALSLVAGGVTAQQEKGKAGGKGPPQQQSQPKKPWKEEIVGSWRLLIIDGIKADGTHQPLYGPNPKGLAMFSPDGHYSIQIMRDVRPKFAANDRLKGTTEELKNSAEGIITYFGTYTIDEQSKTLSMRVEGSSFPNWDDTTQKRMVSALEADEFVYTNEIGAAPSLGNQRTEIAWHRIK
jgi:Lipocalin-like domain